MTLLLEILRSLEVPLVLLQDQAQVTQLYLPLTASSTANGVISVADTKFTDAAGNTNADSGDANNTATISVDTVLPTITGVTSTTANGSYKPG